MDGEASKKEGVAAPSEADKKAEAPAAAEVKPAAAKKGKGKGSPAELLFTLKKSVFQKADPWFPMGKELEEAVGKGIDLYLKSQSPFG